ncbi:MAG: hypothetical protein HOQ05_03565 [Corynebacteriales bacterium]|nr:hypothetical protein [Mycobacteriales bacterium]
MTNPLEETIVKSSLEIRESLEATAHFVTVASHMSSARQSRLLKDADRLTHESPELSRCEMTATRLNQTYRHLYKAAGTLKFVVDHLGFADLAPRLLLPVDYHSALDASWRKARSEMSEDALYEQVLAAISPAAHARMSGEISDLVGHIDSYVRANTSEPSDEIRRAANRSRAARALTSISRPGQLGTFYHLSTACDAVREAFDSDFSRPCIAEFDWDDAKVELIHAHWQRAHDLGQALSDDHQGQDIKKRRGARSSMNVKGRASMAIARRIRGGPRRP